MVSATLDTSPKAFWEELEASRKQQEDRLFAWEEMRGRYHGPYWDKSAKHGGYEPENPAYEILATLKAQFVAGDPRCAVKTTRTDESGRFRAIALAHSLNRLSRDGDDKRFWRKQFVDWCFSYSAFCVQRTPAPWADRGPMDVPLHRPILRRISPLRLRYDPRCTEANDRRWIGYELISSKGAVLARTKTEQGWRVSEIEKINPDTGIDSMLPKGGNSVTRDDFKLYIVWVPEEQTGKFGPDKGFWGTIHFFAEATGNSKDGGLLEIRDPQPYYGPRAGPIYVSGQETVPDSPHPLSVMVSIENLAKSLRLQSTVIHDAMSMYKRFVVVGGSKRGVAEIIKKARHSGIVNIPSFVKGNAIELTTGGVSSEMLEAYMFLVDRMDRRSGLSGTARGQATAGATATAEAIAQGGSAARIEGLRDEFYSHVRDSYRARAEIIDMDEGFFMPLSPEAIQEMAQAGIQAPPYAIVGGREKGESFEDYELDIDPLSMKHQTQEDREIAVEREMNLWTTLGTLIPSTPFIDWDGNLTDWGDFLGRPALRERVNYPMAEQMAGLMLMGAIQQGTAFQGGEPRQGPMATKDAPILRTMDTTGTSKPAGQSGASAKPQLGSGMGSAARKPVGGAGLAGNRSGSKAGAGAKSKAKAGSR